MLRLYSPDKYQIITENLLFITPSINIAHRVIIKLTQKSALKRFNWLYGVKKISAAINGRKGRVLRAEKARKVTIALLTALEVSSTLSPSYQMSMTSAQGSLQFLRVEAILFALSRSRPFQVQIVFISQTQVSGSTSIYFFSLYNSSMANYSSAFVEKQSDIAIDSPSTIIDARPIPTNSSTEQFAPKAVATTANPETAPSRPPYTKDLRNYPAVS